MKTNELDTPKRPLIILTGPTAVGKTNLSISLAKEVNGEIICADSMQVYKHMDIGSAKIKSEEMQGIPHYMIDVLEPTEEFNVVIFQKYAQQYIEEIYSHGKIPILVGGTGFYIQAVRYHIDFTENEEDTSYRKKLEEIAASEGGCVKLHNLLKETDPLSAQKIHAHNSKRVIRALEFQHLTGGNISEHNEKEQEKEAYYDSYYFVLNDAREVLYDRINQRVDNMLADGLLQEIQMLKSLGCVKNSVAMQGLGYKELFDYPENEMSLEEAVYKIKRDTRHFAKRQLTWFRRERDVIWVNKQEYHQNEEKMLEFMKNSMRSNGKIGRNEADV